jgi:hypothetical protein
MICQLLKRIATIPVASAKPAGLDELANALGAKLTNSVTIEKPKVTATVAQDSMAEALRAA